jgi:hypothetical protein
VPAPSAPERNAIMTRALNGRHRISVASATPKIRGAMMPLLILLAGCNPVLILAASGLSVGGGLFAAAGGATVTGVSATVLGFLAAGATIYRMWSDERRKTRKSDAEIEERQTLINSLRSSNRDLWAEKEALQAENAELKDKLYRRRDRNPHREKEGGPT